MSATDQNSPDLDNASTDPYFRSKLAENTLRPCQNQTSLSLRLSTTAGHNLFYSHCIRSHELNYVHLKREKRVRVPTCTHKTQRHCSPTLKQTACRRRCLQCKDLVGIGMSRLTSLGRSRVKPTATGINVCSYCNGVSLFQKFMFMLEGKRWSSWLRHCVTSRKDAGSIPDDVIGIFH